MSGEIVAVKRLHPARGGSHDAMQRVENEIRASERDFTIGLRPDTFLTPRERRHSVIANAEQPSPCPASGATMFRAARF